LLQRPRARNESSNETFETDTRAEKEVTAEASGPAYVAGLFIFWGIIYFVFLHLRRRKYQKVANELGAEYQSQGLFKPGKIAGSSNQRTFTIETVERSRATWTTVEMACVNRGIPLHIHGRFFKSFPNWKYAFTRGDRTERVFVTHITLQNVGIPLDEKYRTEVQGLFQETALLDYAFLKKGLISVESDRISCVLNGALKKLGVIREILTVLLKVADRIESAPVV
jgi:hypothetical protein